MTNIKRILKEFESCIQHDGWTHCMKCEYKKTQSFLICRPLAENIFELLKEQDEEIKHLRLALDIMKGNGIKVDTEGR